MPPAYWRYWSACASRSALRNAVSEPFRSPSYAVMMPSQVCGSGESGSMRAAARILGLRLAQVLDVLVLLVRRRSPCAPSGSRPRRASCACRSRRDRVRAALLELLRRRCRARLLSTSLWISRSRCWCRTARRRERGRAAAEPGRARQLHRDSPVRSMRRRRTPGARGSWARRRRSPPSRGRSASRAWDCRRRRSECRCARR